MDFEHQGEIELQIQNLSHFLFCYTISHQWLKYFHILDQKCILALLKSLSILGEINFHVQFHF